MFRWQRSIPTLALCVLLAACGRESGNPIAPDGPSMDGGVPATGGNRSDSTSTGTTTTGTTTGTMSDPVPGDSTGNNRGGVPATGGN